MNAGSLVAKNIDPNQRSVAKIISIQFIPAKKVNDKPKSSLRDEVILFYTKPIFKAKKYELF
jgi:hypothetical protein